MHFRCGISGSEIIYRTGGDSLVKRNAFSGFTTGRFAARKIHFSERIFENAGELFATSIEKESSEGAAIEIIGEVSQSQSLKNGDLQLVIMECPSLFRWRCIIAAHR